MMSKVPCALFWDLLSISFPPPLPSGVQISKQNRHRTFDIINTLAPEHVVWSLAGRQHTLLSQGRRMRAFHTAKLSREGLLIDEISAAAADPASEFRSCTSTAAGNQLSHLAPLHVCRCHTWTIGLISGSGGNFDKFS